MEGTMTFERALGRCLVAGLLACGLHAASASADTAEDFYKGKTISLIIGSGEGASYDLVGRLVGQYLQRYIPGHPTIVPRNMPGASSVRATEYFYNAMPRDGTSLAFVQPTVVLNKITDPKAKYEPHEFKWLGRVGEVVTVGVVWHTAPAHTVQEAMQKEVVFGAAGATGYAAQIPWALNRLVGTKFNVVRGYQSMATEILAMERGEVQGIGSLVWDYFPVSKPDWVEKKMVLPIYTISLERYRSLPDVPTIVELAKNDLDRNVMKLFAGTLTIGYAVAATPQIPDDRLAALRKAFDSAVKDPEFLAEAKRRDTTVDPLPGPELDRIVAELVAMPREVIDKMDAVVQPPRPAQ
jgi:tripartite-type tricarboxylate transporter receptor subunit TctC